MKRGKRVRGLIVGGRGSVLSEKGKRIGCRFWRKRKKKLPLLRGEREKKKGGWRFVS